MKKVIVSYWNATNPKIEESFIYTGITRKQAIINFIEQYFNKNYNTRTYAKDLNGIYKSHVIKDRLLFDYTENIVIYSQFA